MKKTDVVKYGDIPFVHGLYEFQVTRLDREPADLVRKYTEEGFGESMAASASWFLRTIPVRQSLEVKHNIAAYEDAREILQKADNIVVTESICRKSYNIFDMGCDKPPGGLLHVRFHGAILH